MKYAPATHFSLSFHAVALLVILSFSMCKPVDAAPQSIPKDKTLNEDKPLTIRYPYAPKDPVYNRQSYYYHELLESILRNTGRRYKIIKVPVPVIPSSREIRYLESDELNLLILHTNNQREKDLRPLKVPLFRGLSGWRLLIIRDGEQPRFNQNTAVEDLRPMIVGQGHDWPDVPILESQGFTLLTAPTRFNLFKMLNHGRIDFFPRGVFEIWDELQFAKAEQLVIEENIALQYPTAHYFFLNRKNEAFAQILDEGFKRSVADGSYLKLFYKYFGETIKKARLKERKVLTIDNPNWSDKALLKNKTLWYHIGE